MVAVGSNQHGKTDDHWSCRCCNTTHEPWTGIVQMTFYRFVSFKCMHEVNGLRHHLFTDYFWGNLTWLVICNLKLQSQTTILYLKLFTEINFIILNDLRITQKELLIDIKTMMIDGIKHLASPSLCPKQGMIYSIKIDNGKTLGYENRTNWILL